jgi:UDP-glucose 4-epimerase
MVDIFKKKIDDFYKSKSVLITGASGYIGTHITNKLLCTGCNIKCFTRNEVDNKKDNIQYIFGDYNDKSIWSEHLNDIDIIFHLAAQTSLYTAEKNQKEDYMSNVYPLKVILDELQHSNNKPFIVFAGTATQCGLTNSLPVDEKFEDNPSTVYDFHKLLAENYLKFHINRNNVNGISLRLCNVYGPGPRSSSHDRGIMNIMIKKALENEDLTIFGSGEYLRDYIYINDAVNAFLLSPINSANVNGLHMLLGSSEGLTLKDAISLVSKNINYKYNKTSTVKNINPPESMLETEFRNFVSDNTLIRESLGWYPQIKFEEGIILTAESFL